jgi:hypothetical protein
MFEDQEISNTNFGPLISKLRKLVPIDAHVDWKTSLQKGPVSLHAYVKLCRRCGLGIQFPASVSTIASVCLH